LGGSEDALQKGYDEAVTKGLNNIHLMSGMHILKEESTNRESTRERTQDIAYLEIKHPMTISGDGRGKTFVEGGGFEILGEKDKKCTFMDMTIQKTEDVGLYAYDGMSFHCLRCHFTQCNGTAVTVGNTKGRLTDCQITQCMENGIVSTGSAVVEINGKETTIDHNCQNNDKDESYHYGIEQCGQVAQIQILSPLTRDSISKNNKGEYSKVFGKYKMDNNYRIGYGDRKRIIEVKAFSM
jgi:hypothetical protein